MAKALLLNPRISLNMKPQQKRVVFVGLQTAARHGWATEGSLRRVQASQTRRQTLVLLKYASVMQMMMVAWLGMMFR